MMENTLGNSSTSFFSTPRWTRSSALWVSEWDNRSLTTSSWATRSLFCSLALYTRSGGWLPWKYLVFLLKTEARRALNTYAFSSLHPKEDGGFPWACSFVNVLIEMIVIIFPSVARLSSSWAFLKLFSTWSSDILVLFLSFLALLPRVINSLFFPAFQWKLAIQPGWSSSLPACLLSCTDGSVDSFMKCCCSLGKLR